MRILLVHNKYQQAGGEDKVFESEGELLANHHHVVERLEFDNKEIRTKADKVLSGLSGIYNLRSGSILQQKIIEFRPDIIHVHNFVPLASPSIFFVAKRNNVPVVLTLHNYRLICPSATLFYDHGIYERSIRSLFPFDAVMKGVYRNSRLQTAGLAAMTSFHNIIGTWKTKVNTFIVLTEFAKSKFKESVLGLTEEKFALKPNFVADPGIGNELRDDFFLFIGRLTEEKGIDVLLNAFKHCDHKLVIIGDGPMREKVEVVVHENSNIEYLGFQQKALIMDRLKKSRALLFPSIWYEGFPITILEAFATGTPVIGSKIGGVAEIIRDRKNGLHFEAGSKDDLIRAMNDLNDTQLAKTLGENARSTYLERYTPELNYKLLMDIYQKTIHSALNTK